MTATKRTELIQYIWKDLDAEKDWRQKEKGLAEDKMII